MRTIIRAAILLSFLCLVHIAPAIAQEGVKGLTIRVEEGEVILTWEASPGATVYRIVKTTDEGNRIFYVSSNNYKESDLSGRAEYAVYPYFGGYNPTDEIVIEDFESGSVTLYSYPEEDREPNAWSIVSDSTYQGSQYALLVSGNTWKMQDISPQHLQYSTYWGIAINSYNSTSGWQTDGEIMAFGVSDGDNELFYDFRGSELVDSTHWRNTFFWWGEERIWQYFHLPIGRDWSNAYGYEPDITSLIYVNDEDAANSNGGIYFDYICDITEDMPIAPELSVDYEMIAGDELTVQFYAEAEDPDSDTLYYHWEFSDEESSEEQNPLHTFPAFGTYSIQAEVRDETDLKDYGSITIMLTTGQAPGEFVVNFTGDVMMGRRYWQESWSIIPNYGWEVIWEPTLDILDGSAALTYINLECVFTNDTSEPHPTKEYIFYGQPEYINALAFAGIDGVTLANNHTMDYMEPGITQTIYHLDTTGVNHFGAGMDEYEAAQPLVQFHNGVSIASLGFCNRTGRADNLPPFMEAGPDKFGFAWFTPYLVEETVPQAAELYDIVVVQVHCGIEYAITPDTTQGGDAIDLYDGEEPQWPYPLDTDSSTADLQRMALDLGADIVVAHHPHVLQGYEVYEGKLIAHSMGNFAFDQDYFETFISMILYARMDNEKVVSAWFRPVYIDDYIPNEATGYLGRATMHRIADYSRDMNAVVMPDYGNNIAYIALNESQINQYEEILPETAVFMADPLQVDTAMTYPLEIPLEGFISMVESASGVQDLEIQFGREELWLGNFENEGSTLWVLNSEWESYDHLIVHSGERSLRLFCNAQQTEDVQVSMQENMKLQKSEPHTMTGWIKGVNSLQARVLIQYMQSRFGGVVASETVCGPVSGVQDWTLFSTELDIPDYGNYCNVLCVNDGPWDDDGYAWFDDIKIIHWEQDWQPLPATIPYPNNFNFVRLRGGESMEQDLIFTMVKYHTP